MSTRAQLITECDTNLPDNTAGSITPYDVRQTLIDILNSIATLADAQSFSAIQTFSVPPVVTGLSGLLQGNGASAVSALSSAQAIATSIPGRIYLTATGVNMNSVGDTQIPVTLPSGMTRFKVAEMHVSHASISLTTSTIGLYTAAAAGGVAIVTPATTGITQTATDTNANAASMTILNGSTTSFNDATLYAHVGTAQGAAATADVTIVLIPLP